jgi:hypothetical protein
MDTRAVLCVSLVIICGCARGPSTKASAGPGSPSPSHASAPGGEAQRPSQQPGDYVVYRFSGTFRKAPLTLTQKVLEPSRLELTFDDGKTKRVIRARYDTSPSLLVDAVRVVDGAEQPITRAQLDAMMAETVLAVDANEESLGTEVVTIDVAGRPLKCERSSYRVVVGKKKAVMSSLKSEGFAWGDVGAEIKAEDGKILYRAEVVDLGPRLSALAAR